MGFTRNYDMLRLLDMGVNTDCNALQSGTTSTGLYIRKTDGNLMYNAAHTSGGAVYYYYGGVTNYSPFKYFNNASSSDTGISMIVFGTNGAEETYDDYKVSSFNFTRFQSNGAGNFIASDDGSFITNQVYGSYLNSSGAAQTIREIGVAMSNILVYRKVLETPFEVPVNGYFKISFTYKVPVPIKLRKESDS